MTSEITPQSSLSNIKYIKLDVERLDKSENDIHSVAQRNMMKLLRHDDVRSHFCAYSIWP